PSTAADPAAADGDQADDEYRGPLLWALPLAGAAGMAVILGVPFLALRRRRAAGRPAPDEAGPTSADDDETGPAAPDAAGRRAPREADADLVDLVDPPAPADRAGGAAVVEAGDASAAPPPADTSSWAAAPASASAAAPAEAPAPAAGEPPAGAQPAGGRARGASTGKHRASRR
ncbi:MAG: hypothetical protein IRZ08_16435, partial [Frankia sp.]|nr:hypothetical protein [Frankia sp.]